jgi:hypothetical protein
MNNLISLSGKMRSGKNTVAEYINALQGSIYTYKSFAFKVKQIASMLTGIPVQMLELQDVKQSKLGPEWDHMTVREMLQKIGTDCMRDNLHKDVWVNGLFSDYSKGDSKWIITDVRFPNEFERVKQIGGVVIRIIRPQSELLLNEHESETAMDHIAFNEYDAVIYNDGTIEDLIQKIKIVCRTLV